MVVIWGANFSAVKYALQDFPEIPFNALRLVLASAMLLAAMAFVSTQERLEGRTPPASLGRDEWLRLVILGVIGTWLYQRLFLAGVARTSVANSSLILGCTPVFVALLSSIAGHERVSRVRWAGAALSVSGIYALAGHRASLSSATFVGDLLMLGSTVCWALYTVLAQPLLRRHSALLVTGWSLTIGTALYLVLAVGPMWRTDWAGISLASWALMAASAWLALGVAYLIWYRTVQRIGSARTATYSNLTPVVAMIVAAVWLGERISGPQVLGAGLILAGLVVTRLGPRAG